MKKLLRICLFILSAQMLFGGMAQAQLTTLPRGGNRRASVYEQVGLTDVTIHYSRPGVNGREGRIWGDLIQEGFYQLGYGTKIPAPWRAGANENTTIEFSTDVKIEGHDLPAGRYGFFVAYGPKECILIFSKNSTSWGNFFYDPKEEALRVTVKPVALDKSIERLKYEFVNQTASSATVQLQWEKLMIPFKIDVDVVKDQIASFRAELRGGKALPGLWQPWMQAATYCATNKTNLEEGLMWADSSVSRIFGGQTHFEAWQTKAAILDSLGRKAEAASTMKMALPLATDLEGYTYAFNLIQAKQIKEGSEIMKMMYDKYPTSMFTILGMGNVYSAKGDYKTALTYVERALPLSKGGNRIEIERNIRDLKNGKDMNL